jgi:putative acetyltransferase
MENVMHPSQLRYASRHLVRLLGMLDRQCGEVNLTPVQAHTLIELQSETLTIGQLAERLHVNKSNASRTVTALQQLGLADNVPGVKDKRTHHISITQSGLEHLSKLDQQQSQFYQQVLAPLDPQAQHQLKQGLESYIKSVSHICQSNSFAVRPLTQQDNPKIAEVIRMVSAEYGLTADKGYGVGDPTLDDMYSVYSNKNSAYWVIEFQGRIVGGGGFAPLQGQSDICELQKMYFLPECRRQGLAKRIAHLVFTMAKSMGFSQCYLETTADLKEAIHLYEKLGFEHLDAPLGNTGHDACEVVMAKTL